MAETELVNPTLNDAEISNLVSVVIREHAAVRRQFEVALEHALNAGRALSGLREKLAGSSTRGQSWNAYRFWSWVKSETGVPEATGQVYIRLAVYEDEIREGLKSGFVNSIESARAFVKTLPPINDQQGRRLRELKKSGMSAEAIAAVLGYHPGYVADMLDPAAAHRRVQQERKARQRRKKASTALRVAEREAAIQKRIKEHGGHLSQAYSLCRRLLAAIDKQVDEAAGDREKGRALIEAIRAAQRCEEALIHASQIDYGKPSR